MALADKHLVALELPWPRVERRVTAFDHDGPPEDPPLDASDPDDVGVRPHDLIAKRLVDRIPVEHGHASLSFEVANGPLSRLDRRVPFGLLDVGHQDDGPALAYVEEFPVLDI